VFEPNDPRTWEALTGAVGDFLKGLWENGYFAGAGPEDSFYVKCNAETNPQDEREAGRLNIEIGVAPSLPAEYIVFHVVQQMTEQGEGPE
jgi:phage tail sheath protein FI